MLSTHRQWERDMKKFFAFALIVLIVLASVVGYDVFSDRKRPSKNVRRVPGEEVREPLPDPRRRGSDA